MLRGADLTLTIGCRKETVGVKLGWWKGQRGRNGGRIDGEEMRLGKMNFFFCFGCYVGLEQDWFLFYLSWKER